MSDLWSQSYLKKVVQPSDVTSWANKIRSDGKTIATLNGSFDLLHAGHLQIIFEASLQADILIVALNSDASIKQYKSDLRPIVPLHYRLQLIAALEFVDYVTWFEETTPLDILSKIQPNVHVNGAEYKEGCIEQEIVSNIHFVELVGGLSTSALIEKIQALEVKA